MKKLNDLVVFIVDYDRFCLELYNKYLLNMGFKNICLFENGPDCIEKLELQPDIIFVNYNMEPINGIDMLTKLKYSHPGIFLLMISGQKDMQVALSAMELGAFDYIIKDEKVFKMINNSINKIFQSLAMITELKVGNRQTNLIRNSRLLNCNFA